MAFQLYHPVPTFGRPYTPSNHSSVEDAAPRPSSSIRGRNSISMLQLDLPSPSLHLHEAYHTSYTDLPSTVRTTMKRASVDRTSFYDHDHLDAYRPWAQEEGARKRSSSYRTKRDKSSLRTSLDVATHRRSVILVGSSDGVFHRSATVLAIVPGESVSSPASPLAPTAAPLSQSLSLESPLMHTTRHSRTLTVPYEAVLMDYMRSEHQDKSRLYQTHANRNMEHYEEEEDVVDPFLNRPYPLMSEYRQAPHSIVEPEKPRKKWQALTRSFRDKARDLFSKPRDEHAESFRKFDTFLLKRSWKKTSKQLDAHMGKGDDNDAEDTFSFWNATIFSKRKKNVHD